MEQSELEHVAHIKEAPIMCRIVSIENSSPHWHYEYEVFFVLRAAVTVNSEAGSFRLGKGDLILLNSREIHSISPAERDNLCLLMQWSPALLLEVYDSSFSFKMNTRSENPPAPEKAARFRSVLAEMGLLLQEKPNGYPFSLKSCLYRFIGLLFAELPYKIAKPDGDRSTDQQLEDFDRIKRYIKDHFKEDLSIDRLCGEVAMSRAKVFRLLRTAGSVSVKDMLHYYRVEYAKNLLCNSALTIPYIATESGFESNSSFYRVFKEVTGLAPNQYRTSPMEKAVPMGIQGYAAFQPRDAVTLLREYEGSYY
jgi:AraC-like DNA-binding protein/mannose-6-phosphate isomerase-like protein (cupin superfamily)